jgi:hypothetical protein
MAHEDRLGRPMFGLVELGLKGDGPAHLRLAQHLGDAEREQAGK